MVLLYQNVRQMSIVKYEFSLQRSYTTDSSPNDTIETMRIDERNQNLRPNLVRGEPFVCNFAPLDSSTLTGATFRFAICLDDELEQPIVTVTGTLASYGQINVSGTTVQVVLRRAATTLLTSGRWHAWTMYVTPSGDEEYVWAMGKIEVVAGAGEVS